MFGSDFTSFHLFGDNHSYMFIYHHWTMIIPSLLVYHSLTMVIPSFSHHFLIHIPIVPYFCFNLETAVAEASSPWKLDLPQSSLYWRTPSARPSKSLGVTGGGLRAVGIIDGKNYGDPKPRIGWEWLG